MMAPAFSNEKATAVLLRIRFNVSSGVLTQNLNCENSEPETYRGTIRPKIAFYISGIMLACQTIAYGIFHYILRKSMLMARLIEVAGDMINICLLLSKEIFRVLANCEFRTF